MLTVLLATRDRADTLATSLVAFTRLEQPQDGWKLVVVDNGSSDSTKAVVSSFAGRLPLAYLSESTKGKNAALNAGLGHVVGDLVVFTDDDVVPRPDWLRQIREEADLRPAFSIFGGPVLPLWEKPPPSWLLEWVPLSATYTILYPRPEGPNLPIFVFGPNMAIRASVFRNGYRFDRRIGPRGRRYPMGSESELLLRLEKAGYKTWHCPKALVYHVIRADQMTQRWALSRAFRYGRGMYRLQKTTSQSASFSILGSRLPLHRELLWRSLQIQRARRRGEPGDVFKHRWYLRYHAGRAAEAGRLLRERMDGLKPGHA